MADTSDSSPSEAAVSPAYLPHWGPFQAQVAIRRRHLAFCFYIWYEWLMDKRWEEYCDAQEKEVQRFLLEGNFLEECEDAQGAEADDADYRQLRLF